MDHERVLYRLMQPSLAMIAQVDEKLLPPLYSSPLFWLGLAISFRIGVITAPAGEYPILRKKNRRRPMSVHGGLSDCCQYIG